MSMPVKIEQSLEALSKGNSIRRKRAAIRRGLRDGQVIFAEAIEHEACQTMTVEQLLSSFKGIKRAKTQMILNEITRRDPTMIIGTHREIGQLTERERRELAVVVALHMAKRVESS